jgi:hypothetical protein
VTAPTDAHPWFSAERARRLPKSRRPSGWLHHGEWKCTHLLTYEDDTIARLYYWRGAYYTLEQFTHGEPGYTRKDLREGEDIESAHGEAGDE